MTFRSPDRTGRSPRCGESAAASSSGDGLGVPDVADVDGVGVDEEAEIVTVRAAWGVVVGAEPPPPPPPPDPPPTPASRVVPPPPPPGLLTAAIGAGARWWAGESATTIVLARLVTPPGVVAAPIALPTPSISRIEIAAALASGMRSPTRSVTGASATATTAVVSALRLRSARSPIATATRRGSAARRAPTDNAVALIVRERLPASRAAVGGLGHRLVRSGHGNAQVSLGTCSQV